MQRLLRNFDSDGARENLQPAPAKSRELATELRGNQSKIDVEVENWYCFHPPHRVNNPTGSWIDKSEDPANVFSCPTKFTLNI